MNSQTNNQKNEQEQWARDTLLSSIAAYRGLTYKDGQLLEGSDVIAEDDNSIAKKLLGQMTTANHIESKDSILSVISKLYNYDQLIEAARPEFTKKGLPLPETQNLESRKTGTVEWFKRMTEICGQ